MDKLRTLFGINRPVSSLSPERQESNVATSNQSFSTSLSDDSGPSNTAMATSGPMCFRIANIPSTWNQDDLLNSLKKIDPSLDSNGYELSLFPACQGSSQTALLNFDSCTEFFQRLKPNDFNNLKVPNGAGMVWLTIDCHFYDLTPLNSPGEETIADVVAVTGLAGHAFRSWTSDETHQMWLKDFLPHDVRNIRVMVYGYDSSLTGASTDDSRLIDYRRNFIQKLQNSRSSAESRPIIFIGHSLGGILILQTLVASNRDPLYKSILSSTHGIFLFATPHQGLTIKDFNISSHQQRSNLIMQLKDGSEFLEGQKEDMIQIWEGLKQRITMASFYEIPSGREQEFDEEGGIETQTVKGFSALTFLQCEHRIPVNKKHTEIVKFATPVDQSYQTAVTHLNECIRVCEQLRNLAELNPVNVQMQAVNEDGEMQERLGNLRNSGGLWME